MSNYILKRLLHSLPMLVGITMISFFVMQFAPGRPTDVTDFSAKISAESKQRLVKLYGLDKPLHIQYVNWLWRVIRLDFGDSFKDGQPAIRKIAQRLPATLLLNILSLALIFAIAIPVGVFSAVRHNSFIDKVITFVVYVGYSLPAFWLALMGIILFGLKLGLLPISGLRSLNYEMLTPFGKFLDISRHLVLPVIITAFTGLAGLTRYSKTGMLEVLRSDFIRFAHAKGLDPNRILFVHALKNAMLPIVTIVGLSLPGLIGGGFIFETIFAYPGMGRLGYESIMARDYPVIMAVGVIVAALTLFGNILADVLYAFVDPRIRYQ